MSLVSPDVGPFLVCQVLNMKPAEILGMLEEAAGTRMYENKKEGALRTLDKKQLKVDEIQKVRGAGSAQLLMDSSSCLLALLFDVTEDLYVAARGQGRNYTQRRLTSWCI